MTEQNNWLDWIAQQEYLGRGILIGATPQGKEFVAYFVTGRSDPSRARRFELKKDSVETSPTDEKTINEGNRALLIYPAIQRVNDSLVVSNGAQTSIIADAVRRSDDSAHPSRALNDASVQPVLLENIDLACYEPDAPNYTPRISGILSPGRAALSILKKGNGLERQFFEFPLVLGRAKFISTYTGQNVQKGEVIPSFVGEPRDFEVPILGIEEISKSLYQALGPKQGEQYISPGQDFRVGVAVAGRPNLMDSFTPTTINRHTKE